MNVLKQEESETNQDYLSTFPLDQTIKIGSMLVVTTISCRAREAEETRQNVHI